MIPIDNVKHAKFTQSPTFPIELQGRFNSFIVTAFDDSMTAEMQMRVLRKNIFDNADILKAMIEYLDTTTDNQFDIINGVIDEFNKIYEWFLNSALPESITVILNEWFTNGKLAEIINVQVFNMKATELSTIATLKSYNATLGETIHTKGYHVAGDGGSGTYLIVSSGVDDGGSFIKLQNNLYAKLVYSEEIRAKQFGVKMDNIQDDTIPMNNFLKLFGKAKLVVETGVSLITDTIVFQGLWNPETNKGSKQIEFKNHSFNYQGVANGISLQIYNHQKSVLDGISLLKTSVLNYVNFAAFWYSECNNFDIPKICFNKDNSKILTTLKTTASYTFSFNHGVTYLDMEFYGVGTEFGGNTNSALFQDVKMQGNQIPFAEYNLKFYGTTFQNFKFQACDLSYSSKAILYIDVVQARTMRINFDATYFDSQLPPIDQYNFKGAFLSFTGGQMASSQTILVKTKNFLTQLTQGNYGLEGSSPKAGGYNLARNGDLLYQKLSGWLFRGTAGTQGNPDYSFVSNEHQINGWCLRIPFNEATQYVGFNGIKAPFEGIYTVAIRMKKTQGSGKIQISFNPTAPIYDLKHISDGEEIILTANTYKLQGDTLGVTVRATEVTATMQLEVYEVVITPTEHISVNIPVHPKAVEYPVVAPTNDRPKAYKIMQTLFDSTLNKPIMVKSLNPDVWIDSSGTVV